MYEEFRPTPPVRRTTRLRHMLTGPGLEFLMEAHNGVSAKIVGEAGFQGLWASGLTMSASFGVRDNNELSWSQVVDQAGFMADAASIPILLDGDTGHGNFNNMRRFVRKLEQAGVAGVVIEDKQFPKLNSFLREERQPLAAMDEFCGKIQAGKDSQHDDDFVVIARVEALIAGWGMAEALRRAEAYWKAGADAILIHSKQPTPAEIFMFLDAWERRCPVVLVPTKYYTTPTADFRERKVSLVIWANHLLRASIVAMESTARRVKEEQTLINVEQEVATLREVFRLQGDHELEGAEARYLPTQSAARLSAVVLAAGAGGAFGGLTDDRPKAMLKVRGRTILGRLSDDFESFGCRQLTVVRGHQADAVQVGGATYVDNTDFAETGEAYSLSLAVDALKPGTLVSFGDIVLKRFIIHSVLEEAGPGLTIAVDSQFRSADYLDRVICDRAYTGRFELDATHLKAIGASVAGDPHGAWIGLLHAGQDGATWLREAIDECREEGTLGRARLADVLTRIMRSGRPIQVVYTHGGWINVNNTADLLHASAL